MRFFDLHCDTIGECYKGNKKLYENDLHVSLSRASHYENYTQVFAVWIPDELRGQRAASYFNNVADYFYNEIEENKNIMSLYQENKDTQVKAVLSVEGGSACGGTIDGLHHLYNRGVRVITLTWNDRNEIAGGAFSDGGFTDFGKDFVKVCEELGIIIDVSHLNRESFFQLSEFSQKPFIASHSNSDIVDNYYGRKRNLSDEQIEIIRDRKGLIGINFCSDFLHSPEREGYSAIREHINHLMKLDCEDVISFGSDYDGCDMHHSLKGVEKVTDLYRYLLVEGFSEKQLDKFFYANAENFFNGLINKKSL